MKEYSNDLIIKYVNGEDITNIEELESDREFMKKVIDYTNDKNIYNLCSPNLKNDYDFVKYLILKFKDDIEFITNVCDIFLDNVSNDYQRIDILITINDFTKDKLSINKYGFILESIYSAKRLSYEIYKLKKCDNSIGMGFILIYDDYLGNERIINYFAKKMINDLIKEYDVNLSELLFSKFKNVNELNKYGVNNFIINLISKYDLILSDYVSTHLFLLSDIKNDINYIMKTRRIGTSEREKYNNMFDKVHEYIENVDSIFTEEYLIYYIGSKLGILDKLKKYDYASLELINYTINDLDDNFVSDTLRLSFEENIHYNEVKKIMLNELFGISSESKLNGKGKILDIKNRYTSNN